MTAEGEIQPGLRRIFAEYKERGSFTVPILWVDDQGVSNDKLQAFSQAADAKVKVVEKIDDAVEEWRSGNYVALVVDHFIGEELGFQVIERISDELNSSPYATIVVTNAFLISRHRSIYDNWGVSNIYRKDQDYGEIGRGFRADIEMLLAGEGAHPGHENLIGL